MTKRKRRQLRRRRRFIMILIIIIIVFIVVKNDKKEEIINTISNKLTKSYLNKTTNSSEVDIKEEWEKVIVSYLDLYTDSLVNLKSRDVTSLFANKDGKEAYLAQTSIDLLVYHHNLQINDMRLKKAYYDIEYKKVLKEGNRITIEFLENDYYNFKYLDGITSKSFNTENTFVLKSDNNKYYIDSIDINRGNYYMFSSMLGDNYTKDDIDNLKIKYENKIKEESEKNILLLKEANSNKYNQNKECDNDYDRKKALDYSYEYVGKRNDYYLDYSFLGGNCANFASQSIHEGGIPMDYKGEYEWKYYSDELNEKSEKRGRSSSWVSTYYFYKYAKYNTGYGLCAEVDVNLFYAEVGDIIHVGFKDDVLYSHTTLVSKVVKKDGKIVDILVNSNTTDLVDYPVMGYTYFNKRLIKILGYND